MDDINIVWLKFIVNEIGESELMNLFQKPLWRAPYQGETCRFVTEFKPPDPEIEMDDIIIVWLKFIVNEIWESELENLVQKRPSRAP